MLAKYTVLSLLLSWLPGVFQPGSNVPTNPLSGASVAVVNAPGTFVGVVHNCRGGVVQTGADCDADVTQFAGITFTHGNYARLTGTYNVLNPTIVGGGFHVDYYRFNGINCGADSNKCGENVTELVDQVATLQDTYNNATAGLSRGGHIKFTPGDYITNPATWWNFEGQGYVLDFCEGPVRPTWDQATMPSTTLTGNGSVTVGTDPTLVVMATATCTGSACYARNAPVLPGYSLLLNASLDWSQAQDIVVVDSISTDGKTIKFNPARSGNYTGPVAVSNAHLYEFNNQSRTTMSGPEDIQYPNTILCGSNFMSRCINNCAHSNPWSTPARTAPTARTIPLVGGIVRHGFNHELSLGAAGNFAGPADRYLELVTGAQSGNTFGFGSVKVFYSGTGDEAEVKNMITNTDDTTVADDGPSCGVWVGSPGVNIEFVGLYSPIGRAVCIVRGSNIRINATQVEDADTLVYAPIWFQNIYVDGPSQEHTHFCGGGGQPTCIASGARHPFYDLHTEVGNPGDTATLDIRSGRVFRSGASSVMLKNTDASGQVVIHITGTYSGWSSLFSLAGNNTILQGDIVCKGGSPACDAPSLGTISNIGVQDQTGARLWGRNLP